MFPLRLVLLLLIAPTVLLGQMLPIFGPKQYTRDTGKPQTVVDSFQNCELAAQYQMVVNNGNSDGSDRVSSGSIVLNGAQVFGPQDFNQQVNQLTQPVALLAQNQLEVTLASKPGSFLTIDIECTSNCLNVSISSPTSGSNLSTNAVLVLGGVSSSADEIGVAINGTPAFVAGQQFAVPQLPLALGTNQLTAIATNACGNKATATTQINVTALNEPPVTLIVAPANAVAPATVSFTADISSANPVSLYQWQFGEDGVIDASGPGLSEVTHTYTQPGLFLAAVTATDSTGTQFSQQVPILIFSQGQINTILSSRWQGLKSALNAQNAAGALQFFHPGVTDKFNAIFAQLGGQLPQIASSLGEVGLFSLSGGVAEMITLLPQPGGGTSVYFVEAMQDADGLWKFVTM